jgi:hypothetical protein
MKPVNTGNHADYQHFIVKMLRKHYPDSIARSTWDKSNALMNIIVLTILFYMEYLQIPHL